MIIIVFYFQNVAFFHAKLRSDICPRVDNQTSGETLQDLTRPLVEKPLSFHLIHHEHFSAQVNKHRKCANVTVIYQIKMFFMGIEIYILKYC